MISGSILSVVTAPEPTDSVATSLLAETPQIVQLGAQVRALRRSGKRVIVFCPVGENVRAEHLVRRLAQWIGSIDPAPILVLSLRTDGKVSAVPSKNGAESPRTPHPMLLTMPPAQTVGVTDNSVRGEASLVDAIAQSRLQAEYVLVDAPSLLQSAATTVVVGEADAVILIVQQGVSLVKEIEQTRRQCLALHASVVGFVFVDQGQTAKQSKP